MTTEQEVTVKTEDGREYPAILFGGRLDIDVLKDQLAQDGLILTKLDGKIPYRNGNGLSRTVFTTTVIQAQTIRQPDTNVDMTTEQEVTVKSEDGREYPAILFGGRLDIDVFKDQLARDGLILTKLDGKIPCRNGNGLSRTVFTTTIIQAQTIRQPGADVADGIVSSLQAMAVKGLSITSKGVTSQEESAQSLVLTLGSRLSTTQAEKVFSRLHVNFTYSGLYGDMEDQQHVPTFHWPPEATKDSVAEAACQHLQSTYMPEDVVVIAAQSVVWMGHEWPEAKVKIKETTGTDYVMVYKGLAPEMLDSLIDKQRMCAELRIAVSKQEIQLQKPEDMHEESQFRPRQASKRRKGAIDSSAMAELVTLKEQLAESKQQLHDAYQERIAALKDLLLHTVGHYQAKPEKAWTKVSPTARAQAALGWLVLNANQLESSSSHPGSVAMAGDFNKHFFYPPTPAAISTLHSLQTILKVQAKRTLDTQQSRASTAAHVKMTLENLCNQLLRQTKLLFLKVPKQVQTQEQGDDGMTVSKGMRWQIVVTKMSMDESQVLLMGLTEVARVEAKIQENMRQAWAMFWV
ncbi:hypothetical protein ABBQ38_003912 [Trebouxia sp. C0009 RCD-2024]